jgi:hypothetical protein
MKRTPFIVIIGLLLVVLVAAYGGYNYWQKSKLDTEMIGLASSLDNKKADLLQYENQQVLSAINAKRTVKEIESEAIKWSEVIKTVRSTIPKNKGDFLVDVLSYSGSTNSELNLTVKTMPDSDAPYFDVADLIETFDDSRDFSGSFVSSISSGTDDEGAEILSFSLATQYIEETVQEALEETVTTAIEEEVDDGVTR